ncbi:DUF4232 domain-containing protein [Streptomyces sp. NPDC094143]|uniref:DUF4232 domain-containing protein n=1 Tax=Streptomyces sp. NPDC094143 TaxID=3155310 RepID=UPI00331ADA0F
MRMTTRLLTRLSASSLVLATAFGVLGTQAASADTAKKPSAPVTCTAANTELAVSKVKRPINHLLLTATNTGSKPCNAYGAPFLRTDPDAQAPVAWNEDTRPQAVVTLRPGASAYAGLGTYSPDGDTGHRVKQLGVLFTGAKLSGSVGPERTVRLPGSGAHFNSSAYVTYWQATAADALS